MHEAAARALRAARPSGGKLPSLAVLQTEHTKLTERKTVLNSEYAKLKKQACEIGVIKSNVDVILGEPEAKSKAKRQETQR